MPAVKVAPYVLAEREREREKELEQGEKRRIGLLLLQFLTILSLFLISNSLLYMPLPPGRCVPLFSLFYFAVCLSLSLTFQLVQVYYHFALDFATPCSHKTHVSFPLKYLFFSYRLNEFCILYFTAHTLASCI